MARAQTKMIIAVDTSLAKNVPLDPSDPTAPKNPKIPKVGATGVYMVDNRAGTGSTNEGASSLSTVCNKGDFLSWEAVTMDPYTTDSVVIQSFESLEGNVFGENGDPQEVDGQNRRVWQGRAENGGTQHYKVSLLVTKDGIPAPVACFPAITAN